jgi:hypothetical protein
MHIQGNLSLSGRAASSRDYSSSNGWLIEGSLIGNYPGSNFGGGGAEAKGDLFPQKFWWGHFWEITKFRKGQLGHKLGRRSHQQVKIWHYPEAVSRVCVCVWSVKGMRNSKYKYWVITLSLQAILIDVWYCLPRQSRCSLTLNYRLTLCGAVKICWNKIHLPCTWVPALRESQTTEV